MARENEILRVALRDSNAERATLKALLERAGSTLPLGFRRSLALADAPQHPRIAMLERVRDRLNETNDRLVRGRDAAREQAGALQNVSERYVELRERLEATQDELARSEARVRALTAENALGAEHVARLGESVFELERRLSFATHALERNAKLVLAFEESHERAAASIAALEDVRRHLEFELASRLALADAKVVESTLTIGRLVADGTLLADTLALRERRIAALEGALREVTVDFVRATEAELLRYRAALASVDASPIGRLRAFLRGFSLRRAAASAAKKRTIVLSRRRTRKRPKPGSDRHLRSA